MADSKALLAELDGLRQENESLREHLERETRRRQLFEAVFSNTQNAILIADDDARYVMTSPSATALLGYSEAEFQQLNVWSITPETDHGLGRALWRTFIAGGEQSGAYQVVDKAGQRKTVHYRAVTNIVPGLHMSDLHDVTALEHTRRQLEVRKEAIEASSQGIFIVRRHDGRHVFVYTNPAMSRITGYPRAELENHEIARLEGPSTDPQAVAALHDSLERGEPYVGTVAHHRRDGSRFWNELRITPFWSGDPSSDCFVGVCDDVTERKEQEIRRDRFAAVVEFSRDAIIGTDLDGRITSWNDAAARMFGYSRAEVLGHPMSILAPPEEHPTAELLFAELRMGKPFVEIETRRRHRDGRVVEVWVRGTIVTNRAGERLGFSFIVHDRSEVRMLEHQLRHAHKMEALGRLAGGIAHDFNNILQVISLAAETALGQLDAQHDARAYMEDILLSGRRGADLVHQIMVFSRQQEPERGPLDLRAVVSESLQMVAKGLGRGIELETKLDPAGVVLGNATQVHQLVANLCTNAAHAMDGRGILRVALDRVLLDRSLGLTYGVGPGAYARLRVSDSGRGIPPEALDRIFDPFFTTKPVGEGMGLGLATVHGIVLAHGAGIVVRSTVGRGTDFEVVFPAVDETATSSRPPDEAIASTGGRLLVVDDEPSIRVYLSAWLRRRGYEVYEAACGEAALGLLEQHAVDLVLTDLAMPGLSGFELAQRVAALRPGLPVVLLTGAIEPGVDWRSKGIDALLHKPVRPTDLLTTIERARRRNGAPSSS